MSQAMFPLSSVSRRAFLQQVGTGMSTLGLASLLAEEGKANGSASAGAVNPLAPKAPHFTPRAKHVIHLFFNGGMSHVDTFDYKPLLKKYHGTKPPQANVKPVQMQGQQTPVLKQSPFSFAQHGQSGLWVSEIFPQLARHADDLCLIRSMHTFNPEHGACQFMMVLGTPQPNRPSLGAWLLHGLGSQNDNLPGFVVLGKSNPRANGGPRMWGSSFLPNIYGGLYLNSGEADLRKASDVLKLFPYTVPYLTPDQQRQQFDLLARLNQLHLDRLQHEAALKACCASFEMASQMQTALPEAFDLRRESKAIHERYGINRKETASYGQLCLTARRLVERGVRMIQVYSGSEPWDRGHDDVEGSHRSLALEHDQPIAALLQDLKARGLLDETLVLCAGEFGRTPTTNQAGKGKGRDHNHQGFTVWLAGGGVKGGYAYGATDEFGIVAVENRVSVHDLHATILHLMGLDHEKLTYRYSGRDFRLTDVEGHVVQDVLA